jgi:signal transduction histidine kinase
LDSVVKHYRGIPTDDVPNIYEASLLHRDGAEIHFEVNTSIVTYQNNPADFVIFRSLEKRRTEQRAQEKMLKYQKLESLGVLAGGISHDFNNLLQGILGNADLALMYEADRALVQTCLKDIKLAAQKASGLALQMLAYSGKGSCDFDVVDVNAQIAKTARVLDNFFSRRALLKYDITSNLPAVRADRSQVSQILVNLVTNAAEAIGDAPGIVTLSTGEVHLSPEHLSEAVLGAEIKPGRYVFIDVTDTGPGIAPEVQDRIFDPFFTTKFTGRGLGLATVFGIVRSHFGAISVSSALHQGATFRVYLPVLADMDRGRTSSVDPPIIESRAQQTILLAEDDPAIRSTAARILERFGYAVVEAADGKSAIDLFSKNRKRIHIVVLDMMMPQMNGKDAFFAIHEMDKNVKTILMSGYAEDEIQKQFTGIAPTGFLQKPFSAKKLINTIRSVLGN